MLKIVYSDSEMMYTGRRPMISDSGDHRSGPTAKPQTMIEQVRMATSSETSYLSSINPNPPVTIAEPYATQTTSIDTTIVTYQRYKFDQFCGLSESANVKVTNSCCSLPFSRSPSLVSLPLTGSLFFCACV